MLYIRLIKSHTNLLRQLLHLYLIDVTGGVASLNFGTTELQLQICKGNLGNPSDPNLQYGHFEPYITIQYLVLVYGVL